MQVPRTGLRKGGYITLPSIKQVAKGAARFTIGTVKWGGILGLLSFALTETPGAAKIINDVLRAIGKLPPPAVKPLEPKEFIDGKPVDMFVAGFDEFSTVQKAINEAKNDAKAKGGKLDLNLDLDNSGWVLDKPAEIESLISILKATDKEKFKDVISLLEMIDLSSQLIFSEEPKAQDLIQGGRPNCELMGALHGLLLSPDGNQKLKAKYKVTNFDYSSDDSFRIDTKFELPNGEEISVSWENLERWMSFFAPSRTNNDTLFVPIGTYAMNEGQKRFGGIPGWLPSSSVTNLTGDKYDTFLVRSLSPRELYNACSQAPGIPVLIGTSNTKWDNIKFADIKKDFSVFRRFLFEADEQELAGLTSEAKGKEFKQSTKKLLNTIISDRNKPSASNPTQEPKTQPPSTTPPTTKPTDEKNPITNNPGVLVASLSVVLIPTGEIPKQTFGKEEYILATHIYAIKEVNLEDDGKPIYVFGDSHGGLFALNEDQLRNHTFSIISKRDNFPNIGEKGLNALLLFISGTTLLMVGSNLTIRRLLKPEYKSLLEKMAIGLYNRVKKTEPSTTPAKTI